MRDEGIDIEVVPTTQNPVADLLALIVDPVNADAVPGRVDEPYEGAVSIVNRA